MTKCLLAVILASLGLVGHAVAEDARMLNPDSDPSRISWSRLSTLGSAPNVRGDRYGAVIKTYSNGYWRQIAAGYRRQAAHDGVKLDIQAAQSELSPVQQLAILETMVGGFYKALMLSPQSTSNLTPAIEDATAAGVPLVDVDGSVHDGMQHFVGAVNRDIGVAVARWFVAHYPRGGKVAVVKGQAGVLSTVRRTAGFIETLAGVGTFSVVATVNGDWDRRKAHDLALALLDAHPDLVGIYCNNDVMALGVVEAVKERHLLDRVHVFGTDGTDEAYASIKAGELSGTVDIFPVLTGEIGMRVAERLAAGQAVPRVVETPLALITRDNARRYELDPDRLEDLLLHAGHV